MQIRDSNKKVLFVDFDGVLVIADSHKAIDPVAASNLHYILEEIPDIEIVISSSWRKHYTLEALQEVFDEHRIPGSFIVGTTPVLENQPRGHEIGLYLKHHPQITDFVIIDDDTDLEPYMDHLVKIDGKNGLTFSDAEKVINKFGENNAKNS